MTNIINVTSTATRYVQDISKVFTDYSANRLVFLASSKNNEIFHHFYENDIGDFNDVNTLFDFNIQQKRKHRNRLTHLLERGKISLRKSGSKKQPSV